LPYITRPSARQPTQPIRPKKAPITLLRLRKD